MKPKFFVDDRGRVGKTIDDARCEYAYGVAPHPRYGAVREISEDDYAYRVKHQRDEMWRNVQALMPLARKLAVPYARLGCSLDELVSDAGVPALCYASVTYVATRASLEAYARLTLTRAYQRAANRSEPLLEDVHDYHAESKCKRQVGQIARDELYSLGLSEQELRLLLARFDSEMSLDEIAAELGVCSRETPRNRINRIITKCRRATSRD